MPVKLAQVTALKKRTFNTVQNPAANGEWISLENVKPLYRKTVIARRGQTVVHHLCRRQWLIFRKRSRTNLLSF